MTHMMNNPVTAIMLLVGLVLVLGVLTVGLRVLGDLDGRQRPKTPAAATPTATPRSPDQ
ncbi:MAG: hypothetical protein LH468_13760 [Nocardioides sp.]|nr:hypothetical protein [Nocardioides sp.]